MTNRGSNGFPAPQPQFTGFGFPATVDTSLIRGTDFVAGANGYAAYMRVREGGQISKIAVHIGTSSGNICVGVYRNVGEGRLATPGARVATSGSVASPGTGYQEINIGGVVVNPGDWFAASMDNTSVTFLCNLAGSVATSLAAGRTYQDAASAFPLPPVPISPAAIVGKSWVLVGVQ